MPRVPIYLNQAQNIAATGGTYDFFFDRVQGQRQINGLYMHPLEIVMTCVFKIVQATSTGAVKGIDIAHLVTGVSLIRDQGQSDTAMLSDIPGEIVQWESIRRSVGMLVWSIPSDIAATTTAGATTTVTLKLHLFLDRPWDGEEKEQRVWWLGAFEKGKLQIKIGSIASVFADSGLSLDATAPGSLDVELECITKELPQVGQDVKWQVQTSTGTGNITGERFPRGVYDVFALLTRRLGNGGFESESIYTGISGAQGGEPLTFPSRWTGADYNNAWFRSGGWMAPFQAAAVTSVAQPIGNRKGVILKAVPPFARRHQEQFIASDPFSLDVTTSGAAASNHRWFYIRVAEPNPAEDARIAAAACMQGPFSAVSVASAPVTIDQAKTLARTLVPGMVNDPKIRPPVAAPGCKPACKC